MNWTKTIKIDDHRVLAFNPYEMKIALLNYGVWCWSKTFDVSVGYDTVSSWCEVYYLGLHHRYGADMLSKDMHRKQGATREFSTLCCLGFEQIIKPDSYSVSKAIEFEPNEEIDAFVHLVISFENSYDKLARSISDNHSKELQS